KLDHNRKMPIPVQPEALDCIDHYLITHIHSDHCDPETIGPILRNNQKVRFYGPPAIRPKVIDNFAVDAGRFHFLSSDKEYQLTPSIRLYAIPAAHEELEKDANGEYTAFSYLLLFDDLKKAVFFGGDTIPFAGQSKLIREHVPSEYNLTLALPVNGRDEARAKLGFKGNLTLDEAIELYHQCKGNLLAPCHWGMFALNDLQTQLTTAYFAERGCQPVIPEMLTEITL
ncbi:MAG: MBL fold metallo-hydrolase, partial [Victivallaceae bacterium]